MGMCRVYPMDRAMVSVYGSVGQFTIYQVGADGQKGIAVSLEKAKALVAQHPDLLTRTKAPEELEETAPKAKVKDSVLA